MNRNGNDQNENGRKFIAGRLPLEEPVMTFQDWCGLVGLISGTVPDIKPPATIRDNEWISALEFAKFFREYKGREPIRTASYL